MNSLGLDPGASPRVRQLLLLVFAILAWLGADDFAQRSVVLDAQAKQAARRIDRASPQALLVRRSQAETLAFARAETLARLQSSDNEQMVRARLVYELRERCNAVPIICQIRLADLGQTLSTKQIEDKDAHTSLETLGVGRARAVLSGSFKPGELQALYGLFADDRRSQWRLNALVVRNNSYELDIERLVLFSESGRDEKRVP